MLVRFGYVAMSMLLEDSSSSKTVTFTNYKKIASKDSEAALNKVRRIADNNLKNCLRLLKHNKFHGIEVFRFSSKIIPLATHPGLRNWNYIEENKTILKNLGKFIKENNLRVTFHPDHFTVINTPNMDVLKNSLNDLMYHTGIFINMGLDNKAKLVTHVGGKYNNKEKSMERFIENWHFIPQGIQKRLTLENDDKSYTAGDVLYICEKLQIPMVLDIHHYRCNHEENEDLREIIPRFIKSWEKTGLKPKIHVSSPRSEKNMISHHDYINPDDIYPFIELMKEFNVDFDVMVEAKKKDEAMLKLVKKLNDYPQIKMIDDSKIIL